LTERQPVVSGAQLVTALDKLGWVLVRQRGGHVRLKLKRGTLAGGVGHEVPHRL